MGREYAGYIVRAMPDKLWFDGPPADGDWEQHFALCIGQAKELEGTLIGAPIMSEHQENVSVGRVIASDIRTNGDWEVKYVIDTHKGPAEEEAAAYIDLGYQRSLSLHHVTGPLQVVELTVCQRPARDGAHITAGYIPLDDPSKREFYNQLWKERQHTSQRGIKASAVARQKPGGRSVIAHMSGPSNNFGLQPTPSLEQQFAGALQQAGVRREGGADIALPPPTHLGSPPVAPGSGGAPPGGGPASSSALPTSGGASGMSQLSSPPAAGSTGVPSADGKVGGGEEASPAAAGGGPVEGGGGGDTKSKDPISQLSERVAELLTQPANTNRRLALADASVAAIKDHMELQGKFQAMEMRAKAAEAAAEAAKKQLDLRTDTLDAWKRNSQSGVTDPGRYNEMKAEIDNGSLDMARFAARTAAAASAPPAMSELDQKIVERIRELNGLRSSLAHPPVPPASYSSMPSSSASSSPHHRHGGGGPAHGSYDFKAPMATKASAPARRTVAAAMPGEGKLGPNGDRAIGRTKSRGYIDGPVSSRFAVGTTYKAAMAPGGTGTGFQEHEVRRVSASLPPPGVDQSINNGWGRSRGGGRHIMANNSNMGIADVPPAECFPPFVHDECIRTLQGNGADVGTDAGGLIPYKAWKAHAIGAKRGDYS